MVSGHHIGKAGEHRVIAELLLRGFSPSLVLVDNGVDIILDNGKTIQVKTAASKQDYVSGRGYDYRFGFMGNRWKGGKRTRQPHLIADFAICWCIPEDRFYIIPKEAIGDRTLIAISTSSDAKKKGYRGGPRQFDKYLNAWEALW
jgi:hypothetical protein